MELREIFDERENLDIDSSFKYKRLKKCLDDAMLFIFDEEENELNYLEGRIAGITETSITLHPHIFYGDRFAHLNLENVIAAYEMPSLQNGKPAFLRKIMD
ncbi:MAG: hypothetical protein AABW56_01170 [Nanoarchaeota archaeon]